MLKSVHFNPSNAWARLASTYLALKSFTNFESSQPLLSVTNIFYNTSIYTETVLPKEYISPQYTPRSINPISLHVVRKDVFLKSLTNFSTLQALTELQDSKRTQSSPLSMMAVRDTLYELNQRTVVNPLGHNLIVHARPFSSTFITHTSPCYGGQLPAHSQG